MSNTLKQGAAQLKELAGTAAKAAPAPQAAPAPATPLKPRKGGKRINDLLAEALNDLFAKYNVPQTATLDRDSRA